MCNAGPAGTPPAPAQEAGYKTHTFSATFSTATVDMAQTYGPNFQWYAFRQPGYQASMAGVVLNSDGSITVPGQNNVGSGGIAAVVPTMSGGQFHGCALGGGAFIEATLKFDPAKVDWSSISLGHPSFWALPIEHWAYPTNDQWPNAVAGYEHFSEIDIFEYDIDPYTHVPPDYGALLHDWYGIYKQSGCGSYCQIGPWSQLAHYLPCENQVCAKFADYHTYGMLWVPATATKPGVAVYYFDGKAITPENSQKWSQYVPTANKLPYPSPQPHWIYGVIDVQHFGLIFGSQAGAPMTIKSLDVWQTNGNNNLSVP